MVKYSGQPLRWDRLVLVHRYKCAKATDGVEVIDPETRLAEGGPVQEAGFPCDRAGKYDIPKDLQGNPVLPRCLPRRECDLDLDW